MSYKAVVTKIFTRPLPGSDNIVLGNCMGYQVIVNANTVDGTLGVMFEQGGQLSDEFAAQNDLIARKGEDGLKVPSSGFFEENRRVKALKLRGAKSEGFWCPLSLFEYTGFNLNTLKEGDQFEELNGHAICNKYFTPKTLRAMSQNKAVKTSRSATLMFAKHIDTEQFKRGMNQIPVGAIIYLSEKCHGTSFRYGHVKDTTTIKYGKFKGFLAKLLKWPTEVTAWVHLNGSRNVVIEKRVGDGFYGKEDFRAKATKGITLRKGEVVYGELVGYTENNQPIMEPQDASKLKDKTVEKAFGKTVVYKYGTLEGQCDVLVYRITMVNEDGHVVELSWPQVVARCRELGLKTVPQIEAFIFDGDYEALAAKVAALTDGPDGSSVLASRIDHSHIQEGIVVRYESYDGTGWLKSKSFAFGLLEGYLKERDDFVDAEEVA